MRCWLILSAVAVLLICGCQSEVADSRQATTSAVEKVEPASSSEWGGLKSQFAGASLETAQKVMILLHGYGASGGDLVPLANVLGDGKSIAFIFPQAPIRLGPDSYAWANGSDSEFERSREQVVALIDQVRTTNPQCRISVGGFSQGATLANNLLAEGDPAFDCVVLYSPKHYLWRELATTGTHPRIFLSHGRNDTVLPFSEAEKLKGVLEARGFNVDWHPFDGGHELTLELLESTKQFLSESSGGSAAF